MGGISAMPLRNLVWLLIVPALVGLGMVVGYGAPAPDEDYRLVRRFVEVMAEVDANYVRELNPRARAVRRERHQWRVEATRSALRVLEREATRHVRDGE